MGFVPMLSPQDKGRPITMSVPLWNMFIEPTPQGPTKSRLMPRPALLTTLELGTGPIRATFTFKNIRMSVSGSGVYNNGTLIGTIPPTGNVRFAVSDDECVIVAGRRAFYVTLVDVARITDPDLPQVRDVVFIAGRFVYFDADTSGKFHWSATNDARTIEGLSFASAESSPDPITGALVIGDNIFILGTKTGEWHYPTDDITAPFQRSRGRRYDKGSLSIASLALVDNAGYFVGSNGVVYRTAQVPERVSDYDMEERLRGLTAAQFDGVLGFRVAHGGHEWYVVSVPGRGTWALDVGTKTWARWTSWGRGQFRASCSDGDVMGDVYSGKLFQFATARYADLTDEPIERICAAFIPLQAGVSRCFNIVLQCARGVGLITGYGSDPKVEMRYSDHEGADFSVWMEADLGVIGDRTKAAMAEWIGMGTVESPGRLCEFRCSDPIFFSPFQAGYNEGKP